MTRFALVSSLLFAMAVHAAAQGVKTEFADGRLARIDDPIRVEFNDTARVPDAEQFRQIATIAAQTLGWSAPGGADERLELTRTVNGKHEMKIEVVYSPHGYVLRYLDSANLMYQEEAKTQGGAKVRAIHKNYNLWVRQLVAGINSAIGLGAVASTSPPRNRPGSAARNDGPPSIAATPLPQDLQVVAPRPGVPGAGFSGTWVGRWDGRFDHTLVVERIERERVVFVYAQNPAQMSDPSGDSWARRRGYFDEDGVLRASYNTRSGPVELSYRLEPDGVHLRAERVRNNRVATATLEHVPTPAAR